MNKRLVAVIALSLFALSLCPATGMAWHHVAARAILNQFARDFEPATRWKKRFERVFER